MLKNLVVANWKLNPQIPEEAGHLVHQIELGLIKINRNRVETVISPPFVFLPALQHIVHFARLGVQNISAEERGPFTGEISATQVLQFRTAYVILGHSERRALGESDKLINRKILSALKYKLEPILCVGWGTKKSFSLNAIKKVIAGQLRQDLAGMNIKKLKITVAYEPVWAISRGLGTGVPVSPRHAAEIIEFIHSRLPRSRLIYGGSVTAANVKGFAAQKNIKGALVGGASLDAREFLGIVEAFSA